jgi:hypothetical protein
MKTYLQRAALPIALMASAHMAMASTTAYTGNLPGLPQRVNYGPGDSEYNFVGPGTVGHSQSTLQLHASMLNAMDISQTSAVGPAGSQVVRDSDGFYISADFAHQEDIGTLVMDDQTHAIQGVTTPIGITLTTPHRYNVAIGGNITFQSLSINLNDHLVYGNILGSHGIVAQSNVALFSFDNADAVLTQQGPQLPVCGSLFSGCDNTQPIGSGMIPYNISLTDAKLTLTQQGIDVMNQSLGLYSFLSSVAYLGKGGFGTLSISTDFYAVPNYFPTTAVPEPTSVALMGLGLAGLICVSRRRKAH